MAKKTTTIRRAPFLLITIFLLMGLTGIIFNEPSRVMHQAWQICLSCIGIG